ncbi:MAG: cox cluster protein [Haloarculaceae archaeon]
MAENSGATVGYARASPWPVFVAGGLAVSELGLLFGSFVVAVGGLLVFGGSVAGMVEEAGYARSAWRAAVAFAVVLLAVGAVLLAVTTYGTRGQAVALAGGLLAVGGVAGELFGGEHLLG